MSTTADPLLETLVNDFGGNYVFALELLDDPPEALVRDLWEVEPLLVAAALRNSSRLASLPVSVGPGSDDQSVDEGRPGIERRWLRGLQSYTFRWVDRRRDLAVELALENELSVSYPHFEATIGRSTGMLAGATAFGEEMLDAPIAHDKSLLGAQFSADGTRILTWSWDGMAHLWDSATGGKALPSPLRHDKSVRGAQFSADGSRILMKWYSQLGQNPYGLGGYAEAREAFRIEKA